MKLHKYTAILGIICIFTLEIIALVKGIDGKGLALAIGCICGIVGYLFKTFEK